MESSDSSLSSDWDVVNQTEISEETEGIPEEPSEIILNNGMGEVKECPPTGSSVEVVTEEDIDHPTDILSEVNVSHHNEILNEAEMNHHNDSNSSSDIDVIEEGDEDMHRSGMLLSPIDFLNTTLAESGPLVPAIAPAPNTGDGWNNFLFTHRLLRNPQFKDCLIVIFISIALAATMHLHGTPEDKLKRMKEQVDELKKENTDLKDRVISKIEDDKLFQNLEEQINNLKKENLKLSGSLESLIVHLQEQTESFKKDNKMKDEDPYKIEIDKLREQVNILKIDNDDLQQQLVRMRYGAFSPYSDDANDDSTKRGVKPDQKENTHENSSDMLTKEIERLKKKLYSEVNDLKDWKKSIDNLIKELNEKERKDPVNKDDLNNKRTTDDGKPRKDSKEETHEKKRKDKFYDSSWNYFKNNFGGTFDNINIPDMLSKYVNYNEKKVKEAFESVGNYFKKAQEKTKNMFKNYNEKGKNEVWDFLGTLRNKWATMKHEFYENRHKKGPQPPKHENGKFASDFPEKPSKVESEKKKSSRWFNNLDQHSNQEHPSGADFLRAHLAGNDKKWHLFDDGEWKAWFKKFLEEEESFMENIKKPENSWMFKRAAIRSILREQGEEEDYDNWFLRRRKLIKEEDSELRKEEGDLIN